MQISTFTNAVVVVVAGTLVAVAAQAAGRDRVHIVGSSTVFPYNQAVAEQFATVSGPPMPLLESTGTGGGMTTFCAGVGPDHPDITGASRAMTAAEWDLCRSNGVIDVTEAHIGSDGLSIAQAIGGPEFGLTEAQLFQALAAEVEVDGAIVANPHQSWSDIDGGTAQANAEGLSLRRSAPGARRGRISARRLAPSPGAQPPRPLWHQAVAPSGIP